MELVAGVARQLCELSGVGELGRDCWRGADIGSRARFGGEFVLPASGRSDLPVHGDIKPGARPVEQGADSRERRSWLPLLEQALLA